MKYFTRLLAASVLFSTAAMAQTFLPQQPEPPGPVINVTDRPLAECLDDFWSPGLSPARLRAMPTAPVTAPDLLLRSFEPPAIAVRGQDLADVLAPIYQRLAGDDG